jgi:eukaryotic-like serine/threonine-protein kinase
LAFSNPHKFAEKCAARTLLQNRRRMFSSSSAGSTSTDDELVLPLSRARSQPRSLEGQLLAGRYRVLAPIGAGGMGTVYEAIDEQTRQVIAIKALKREGVADHVRRFQREAESATSVRHPHICRVHYLGMAHEQAFIVMERLEGETLRARLASEGTFSVADTVAVGVQLLDALAAAHDARVLHRDVKPDNVFIVTPPGQAPFIKVIDFGLARGLPTDSGDTTLITVVGAIPGTPAYLSPEQVQGERSLDEGVDIWAAGLTLFELLTGRHGFAADTLNLLARQIMSSPAPAVREFRDDVPLALEAVIAKALAKRRADRWPSATAFRAALVAAWAKHRMDGLDRGARLRTGALVPEGEPTEHGITVKVSSAESYSSSTWIQLDADQEVTRNRQRRSK